MAIGTESAYLLNVLENENVEDAILVSPGDTLMTRDNGLGGKVDIYVKIDEDSSSVYTETTQSFTYAGETNKILENQPLREVVSVIGSTSGALTENTDYQVNYTTGAFAESLQAQDEIEFLIPPVVGEVITITYNHFSILITLTADVESVRPITADVLIKLSTKVEVDVSVTVTPDSTIGDAVEYRNDVDTAIQSFLDDSDLGGNVEQADLIAVIKAVEGTDNVVIPLDKLAKTGQSGTTDIEILESEYSASGTVSVTVV